MNIVVAGWNDATLACVKGIKKAKPFVIVADREGNENLIKYLIMNRLSFEVNNSLENVKPNTDLLISVSWPFLIRDFKTGVEYVNIHASLLPKYRGRHPINWALLNDEKEFGITYHKIVKELDAGPIIKQMKIPIFDSDDIFSLRTKLNLEIFKTINEFINSFEKNKFVYINQDDCKVTNAPMRREQDGQIFNNLNSRFVFNLIRSCSKPGPGAFFLLKRKKYRVWRADFQSGSTSSMHYKLGINKIGKNFIFCDNKKDIVKFYDVEMVNYEKKY